MIAYSIVITAILMAAIVALGYEHLGRIKAQDAGRECMKALQKAEEKITGYRIEKANRDGVEAGRQSDALYKRMLKQFSAGEQITIMLQQEDPRYYEPKR